MADRKKAKSRKIAETSTLSLGVLLVVALLGLVNYFGWKYHQRMDWTSSELYTLSEKTLNVLDDLDRDVEAIVFMRPEGQLYPEVTELLSRYEAASPRFSVRVLDPERNLAQAQALVDEYQVTGLDVVILNAGEDRRVVQTADLADYDYSGMQFGQPPTLTGFKGEQQFTSALVNLSQSRKPRILFTTGHGEPALDDATPAGLSAAADYLDRENFDVEEWASLGADGVPEGTDLVVVAGPRIAFVEPEVQALRAYVEEGGRLMLFLDPVLRASEGALAPTGLDGLLAELGVELGEDIVVDPANPLPFFGADTIFADAYGAHPITEPLERADIAVIFALARSVRAAGSAVAGEVVELVETSAEGWGETDLAVLQGVEKGEEDLPGPVPLGVAVELEASGGAPESTRAAGEGAAAEGDPAVEGAAAASAVEAEDAGGDAEGASGGARFVVLGDADLITNQQIQQAGNSILVTNAFNWLVARESLIAIPPKTPEQVRLSLTAAQESRIRWLALAVLPGLFLAVGGWVYYRRRR